jgi:ABC-type Na+ transport system ATPase subunit NatA
VPILECDDLRKTFAGGFEAVRGITFDIEEGEAFGLLGPNGAGKTTTMRMLGTLLTPSGGRARSPVTTWCARPRRFAARSASRCRRPGSPAMRRDASTCS